MAKCHVRFIYKPNAFLIILGAFLRSGLQNHQYSTGFIRYFDQLFWMLQNGLGPMLFLTFRRVAKRLPLLVENLMLFLIILEAILRFRLQNDQDSTGL